MTHQSSPPQRFQVGYEAVKLFHVALPSVLIQLSLYWIFPVSASSVGRNLGSVDLAGFSLACMVGNLTCLSIMEGSLTAADTLMPRAFGAQHYNEVARIAVRAVVVGGLILVIPIVPLCFLLRHVLVALGQDEQASELAQTWIRVYFVGALPNLGFRVLMRFLLAQQKPWPLVVTCGFPALVLHPFLIANWVPSMGLVGSAWSIVAVQWTALISLLVYLHFHPAFVPETWPGLSMTLLQKSLQTRPTWQFFRLAVGGILSMNEWWFFEIMCFIAGSFGVVSLDAHTVAYNMLPLLAMFPLGVSIGLAVRMGLVFADEPERAKAMARWCVGFIAVVGALVSLGMHVFRYPIIRMFTNDKDVFIMALQIWHAVCTYIFLMYIMMINFAIYRALGMQWRGAAVISASLYGFTLPLVVYFTMVKQGGLMAQWAVLPKCYTVLNVTLVLGYSCLDWNSHAAQIKKQLQRIAEERSNAEILPSENTRLITV